MELKETLREIISNDFEILKRRDDFLETLSEKIEERKDYNTINRILRSENILDKFYDMKDLSEGEKQKNIKTMKKTILANLEIKEERLDYILDAFLYSIEQKVEISAAKLEKKNTAVNLEKKTDDVEKENPINLEIKTDDIKKDNPINLEKKVDEKKDEEKNVWTCECGAKNSGIFCGQCGKKHGEISAKEVISNVTTFAEQEFKDIKENAQAFSEKAGAELQKSASELSEKAKKKQENYSENSSQNLNLDKARENINTPPPPAPQIITPSAPPTPPPAPQILQTDYTKYPSYYAIDTRDSYFSFEGRMNRKAYCIMGLKLLGWYILACFIVGFLSRASDGFAALIFVIVSIVAIISSYSFTVRRFHDLNRSGWWALTLLIPYVDCLVGLYALFAPGTEGDNEYGPDPLKN